MHHRSIPHYVNQGQLPPYSTDKYIDTNTIYGIIDTGKGDNSEGGAMARRPRSYYAAQRNATPPDTLHSFTRATDRDAWIAADEGHREVIRSASTEVRAARLFEQRNNYQVITRHDD
jgi:hypothetical protein